MSGKLYVVGTPIGNLGDLSERAKTTLKEVDFIAAEDTRVTRKLLTACDIRTTMVSCHEHNIRSRAHEIVTRLISGESCAVVTDAGMPCISDPGQVLVETCRQQGVEVVSVPGPSAAITAISISGMFCERFSFEGFLSVSKKERKKHLEEIKGLRHTLIFYEAPHKLVGTLESLLEVLGDRRIVIARELTKIYEQVVDMTLSQAVEYYKTNPIRGEYVLIVKGAELSESAEEYTLDDAINMAREYIDSGMPPTASAKLAASETGIKKSEIYKGIISDK